MNYKTYQHNSKEIETAENDNYLWDSIDPDTLYSKIQKRYIYQARWMTAGKCAEEIDDDTRKTYLAFWAELEAAKSHLTTTTTSIETESESTWYKINEYGEKELREDY